MQPRKPKQKEIRMKCIAETTGQFGLLNTIHPENIDPNRPSVVTMTQFIEGRVYTNDIKILAKNLPIGASDKEFAEFLEDAKGDVTLAVANYASAYGVDVEGNKVEVEKETPQQKAARLKKEKEDKQKAEKEAQALKQKEEDDAEAARLKQQEEDDAEATRLKTEQEEAAEAARLKALEEASKGNE